MNKLWGGRFEKKTDLLVEEFGRSIHFDWTLAKYDCIGSLLHIDALKKAKLISVSEHNKLKKSLNQILKRIEQGTFKFDPKFEDIHSCIQNEVEKTSGPAGLKLHTCRSRNDQVAFDTKLYCIDALDQTSEGLSKLTTILIRLADSNRDVCMPGYTHLQHAIPVLLSDHLTAYAGMFERDIARLENAGANIDLSMGSGALAGTMIPSECYVSPPSNSIDAVSDRDFVIESLSALAVIAMHLSRLCEDVILWTSQEFDFIDIDDAYCTGSSLMPQKKNPDVLELTRGYTGRLYGNLLNVLVMMKGLPLSYNRDMQHDKEPLFDSFNIIYKELAVLTGLFNHVKFKTKNLAGQLKDEALYATDIADYLVLNKVPFKEAHSIVGRLISHKLKKEVDLCTMTDAELRSFHPLLNSKIIQKLIDPQTSVRSKKSVRRSKKK